MTVDKQTLLNESYWQKRFRVGREDLDFLHDLIKQGNSPRSIDNLVYHLILHLNGIFPKDDPLIDLMAELPIDVDIYQPLNDYNIGQRIFFAKPDINREARVIGKKPLVSSHGSDYLQCNIYVRFLDNGEELTFVCDLDPRDPYVKTIVVTKDLTSIGALVSAIMRRFGRLIKDKLVPTLERDTRFMRFGDEWFLAELESHKVEQLVAEASEQLVRVHTPVEAADVLDTVLTQVPKTSTTVFEVNRAIERTRRFRKVGKRDKPHWVPDMTIWPPPPGKPKRLRIPPVRSEIRIDTRQLPRDLQQILDTIEDEIQEITEVYRKVSQVEFAITASHRHHGTLPLTQRTRGVFPPGDVDAPVTFIDARSGELIPGGFSPQDRYAWGLAEWYVNYRIPAGGKIRLERTEVEGEIKIDYVPASKGQETHWLRQVTYDQSTGELRSTTVKRTYLCEVDKDLLLHGMIFEDPQAMQKEATQSIFDVMCLVFPALAETDESVHCKKVFNCVNLVRRCSPYTVFAELSLRPCFRRDLNRPGHWFFDAQVASQISPAIKIIERLDEKLPSLYQRVDSLKTEAEEQARRLQFLKV